MCCAADDVSTMYFHSRYVPSTANNSSSSYEKLRERRAKINLASSRRRCIQAESELEEVED